MEEGARRLGGGELAMEEGGDGEQAPGPRKGQLRRRRARRARKKDKAGAAGESSAAEVEPHGSRDAEGDTAGGDAVQAAPPRAGEQSGDGGGRGELNGADDQKRLHLGGLAGPNAGRNGGVGEERPGLGRVQPPQRGALARGHGGAAAGSSHATLGAEDGDEVAGEDSNAGGDQQATGSSPVGAGGKDAVFPRDEAAAEEDGHNGDGLGGATVTGAADSEQRATASTLLSQSADDIKDGLNADMHKGKKKKKKKAKGKGTKIATAATTTGPNAGRNGGVHEEKTGLGRVQPPQREEQQGALAGAGGHDGAAADEDGVAGAGEDSNASDGGDLARRKRLGIGGLGDEQVQHGDQQATGSSPPIGAGEEDALFPRDKAAANEDDHNQQSNNGSGGGAIETNGEPELRTCAADTPSTLLSQPLQSGDQKGGGLDLQLGDHNRGARRGKNGNGRAPASNPVRGGEDGMVHGNGDANSNGGRGSEGCRGGDDGNVQQDRLGLAASLGVLILGGGGQPAPMDSRRGGVPVPPQSDGGGGGAAAATSQQLATGAVELAAGTSPIASPPSAKLLKRSTFLSDAVLSWSVSDVLDENLYRDQVQQIPVEFESPEHYANVYSTLLLEETRSILCSDLHNIVGHEYCQLVAVTPCGYPSLYYLDIALKETRSDPINCYHITKDFDVCLLSTTDLTDSHFNIKSCSLGLATEVGRETFFQRSFRVSISANELFQPDKIKFVSFLSNISGKMEISEVLSLRDECDKKAVQTLQEMFRKVGKRCNDCCQSLHCKDASAALPIISSLSSNLNCPHEEYTGVVCAPPGTLKGCISVLMKEFIRLRKKVLICLPKETFIPEFLIDMEEILSPSGKLDGVLVLNSVSCLGTSSTFEKTCLENKSQEVYSYLEQCTGWLKWMSSILELKAFNHSPRCPAPTECTQCKLEITFSVRLFTERFTDIVMKLRECLFYLLNNAPAICLPDVDSNNILNLLDLMDKVKVMLHSTDLTNDSVIEEFGLNLISEVVAMDTTDYRAKSLNEHRISSVKLIDALIQSLQLPHQENRDELDKFCIQQSIIIVTSLDCMGKLHGLELGTFDITIVTGAGQITESDLLVPFVVPMRHIVFFGDHLHLQPFVQSKICKEAGFNRSIYERLQQLTTENLILTHQSVRHPLMNKLINDLFYNEKIIDDPSVEFVEYNKEFTSLELPAVSFINVPSLGSKSKYSRKCDISFAAIVMLLLDLGTDLRIANKKLSICLVCLSKKEANAVLDRLGNGKEIINDRFHLHVKVIDNLDGELFDVIIISTIVEDTDDLICANPNSLNVALTSSRHCCIIIGNCRTLIRSGGITWNKLETFVKKQDLILTVDSKLLIQVFKKLETNSVDHLKDPKYALSRKMKPGQEQTWDGRPIGTKNVLADVRDQRGQPDTCVLQSTSAAGDSLMKLHNANLTPPQDCKWTLSVDDFKKKHEKGPGKKFTSEDIADRGKRRFVTAFERFKEHGVEGRNKCQTKVVKLSAYKEIVVDSKLNPESSKDVRNHLENGNILVGSFRLSMNYYNLRPGEVYVYDEKKPIKHPKSNLLASHAVMMIGIGYAKIPCPMSYFRHMCMQNSEGQLFGINGLGRVAKNSVTALYQIELEKPPGLEPF